MILPWNETRSRLSKQAGCNQRVDGVRRAQTTEQLSWRGWTAASITGRQAEAKNTALAGYPDREHSAHMRTIESSLPLLQPSGCVAAGRVVKLDFEAGCGPWLPMAADASPLNVVILTISGIGTLPEAPETKRLTATQQPGALLLNPA